MLYTCRSCSFEIKIGVIDYKIIYEYTVYLHFGSANVKHEYLMSFCKY